jgi:hypothetical protein
MQIWDLEKKELVKLPNLRHMIQDAKADPVVRVQSSKFSPDGSELVCATGALRWFKVAT